MTTVSKLTQDEIHQINLVLEIFDPSQLAALAEMAGKVILHPGFGEVYIRIEKHHPSRLGVRWETPLPRAMYTPE